MASIKTVLLTINVRWWNAEAAYAVNLARGLIAQGIDVFMVVNPGSPVQHKAEKHKIPIITDILLDTKSPTEHYRNLKKLIVYIDKYRIDLINSFKSNGAFLFSIVRKFRPHITYIKTRGIASPPKNNFLNRYLYGSKACNGVITVGSPVFKWIKTLLGEQSDQRIKTIYYGDSPIGNQSSGISKKDHDSPVFPHEHTVFALLGRTQAVKGHMILLEALLQFKEQNVHLLFLVKKLDEYPEELKKIQDFLNIYGLNDKVTIVGFQERLEEFLEHVDGGVIPSLESEVNCRVAVEFFSMGIPIIAFPTGTLPDIVNHLQNGYLCQQKTAQELVKGMNWINASHQKIEAIRQNAFKTYSELYTLEKMAEDTLLFYEQCKIDSA